MTMLVLILGRTWKELSKFLYPIIKCVLSVFFCNCEIAVGLIGQGLNGNLMHL